MEFIYCFNIHPFIGATVFFPIQHGKKKPLSLLLVLMESTKLLSCVEGVIIKSRIRKNFIIKDVYKD